MLNIGPLRLLRLTCYLCFGSGDAPSPDISLLGVSDGPSSAPDRAESAGPAARAPARMTDRQARVDEAMTFMMGYNERTCPLDGGVSRLLYYSVSAIFGHSYSVRGVLRFACGKSSGPVTAFWRAQSALEQRFWRDQTP